VCWELEVICDLKAPREQILGIICFTAGEDFIGPVADRVGCMRDGTHGGGLLVAGGRDEPMAASSSGLMIPGPRDLPWKGDVLRRRKAVGRSRAGLEDIAGRCDHQPFPDRADSIFPCGAARILGPWTDSWGAGATPWPATIFAIDPLLGGEIRIDKTRDSLVAMSAAGLRTA